LIRGLPKTCCNLECTSSRFKDPYQAVGIFEQKP
jgi:hypothetical protein